MEELIGRARGTTLVVLDTTGREETVFLPQADERQLPAQTVASPPKPSPEKLALSRIVKADDVIIWERPVTKNEALQQLVALAWEKARILSPAGILDAVLEREKQGSTFLNEGVAFPHARIEGLPASCVAIGIARKGISDESTERPIECVFLILSPTHNPNDMIELLALISSSHSGPPAHEKFPGCRRAR